MDTLPFAKPPKRRKRRPGDAPRRKGAVDAATWSHLIRWVFNADEWTCAGCQREGIALQAHHILPRSQGGKDHEQNLISLCPRCHAEQDGGKWRQNMARFFLIAEQRKGSFNAHCG